MTGSSLRVARQRRRAWPILAIALTHLAACNLFASRTAGSFSVTFAWPGGQPPAGLPAPAYARLNVLQAPGTTPVFGVAPVLYTPGTPVSLTAPDLPNGHGYSLIAEIVNSKDSTAQVLYYGVSPSFSIEAGQTPPAVTVQLGPVPYPQPGVAPSPAAVAIVVAAPAPPPVDDQPLTNDPAVTLQLITSIGAGAGGSVEVSNSPGFLPGSTQLLPLTTPAPAVHVPAGLTAYALPWNLDTDLTDGGFNLPCAVPSGCPRTVYVRFQDAHGEVSALATATVMLDQNAPGVLSSTVVYTPPPASPVSTVTAATVGSVVTISIIPDEPIDATAGSASLIATGTSPLGLPVQLTFTAASLDANGAVFTVVVDQALSGLGLTNLAAQLTFSDVAGNKASSVAVPVSSASPGQALTVQLVTTPPAGPTVAAGGPIVYTRIPWGRDPASTTDPTLCPAQPGTPSFCLWGGPGSAFQGATSASQGTTVVVYDGPTAATASQIGQGTIGPNGELAGPNGPASPITLDKTDRPVVYLQIVDAAGNGSSSGIGSSSVATPLAEVLNVSFIATFGERTTGNPSENASVLVSDSDLLLTPAAGASPILFGSIPSPASPAAQEASNAVYAASGGFTGAAPALPFAAPWQSPSAAWLLPQPAPRLQPSLAFDSARGVTVLFGGESYEDDGATWEWTGSAWASFAPANSPAARWGATMAFDSARGVTLLFGGQNTAGALQDTWEWTGSTWLAPGPPTAPAARSNAAMAYDAKRGVAVLFGGADVNGLPLGDTWEWTGAAWTEASSATSPPARQYHAMAFDSGRNRTVLFGGKDGSGNDRSDVWEWDGATWASAAPAGPAPVGRTSPAMAFDSARGTSVIWGGCAGGDISTGVCAAPLSDSWEWNGTAWIAGTAAAAPSGRYAAAMAFDSDRGVSVLFGGYGASEEVSDTLWERAGTVWTNKTAPSSSPQPSFPVAMIFDSTRRRTVLTDVDNSYGDALTSSGNETTWEWDGTTWTQAVTAVSPSLRTNQAVAFDSVSGTTLLFGGVTPPSSSNGYAEAGLADTWLWNGLSWTLPASVAGGPSVRADVSAAFDGTRTLLFGGLGTSGLLNDFWAWNGSGWEALTPSVLPPVRAGAAMTFDPAASVTWLFGGYGANGAAAALGDLWKWDGTAWTQPSPPATGPPPTAYGSMVFDPGRGTVLLFGGCAFGGVGVPCSEPASTEVWEWDGTTWTPRPIAGAPPAPFTSAATAFDSARGQLVVLGQQKVGGNTSTNTWLLPDGSLGRPAEVAEMALGATGESPASLSLQQLTFTARAGGTGTQPTLPATAVAGASLAVWDVSAGGWRVVGTNTSGATSPAVISYTTGSAAEAADYFRTGPWQTVNFAVFPSQPAGAAAGQANVSVGYVELDISYQRVGCATSSDCRQAGRPACNTGTHQCVGCLANSDCGSAVGRPVCNTTANACVGCAANSDCQAPTPLCVASVCAECATSSDCAGTPATPNCDPLTNACVGCATSSDCSNAVTASTAPRCDLASNLCVGCVVDGDCANTYTASYSALPRCNRSNHTCVGCLSSSDCNGQVCDPSDDTCVGCLASSDCAGTSQSPICVGKQCVQCLMNADCQSPGTTTPICDTASNQCVACTATSQCQSGQVCASNLCQPCRSTQGSCEVCGTSADCTTRAGESCLLPGGEPTGTCQAPPTGLSCGGIFSCQSLILGVPALGCSPADAACNASCVAGGSPAAQASYQSLVACLSSPCGLSGGACDTNSLNYDYNDCLSCLESELGGGCSQEYVACDELSCVTNADCASAPSTPACQVSTGLCVQCATDAQCTSSSSAPRCTAAGTCAQCLADADCLSATGTPHCNLALNVCARCSESSQCPAGESCLLGTCAAVPANLDCAGIQACQGTCDTGDASCTSSCLAAGSSAVRAAYAAWSTCSSAACPATGGGVCDATSASFTNSACQGCLAAVEGAGGTCASQYAACNWGCASNADCAVADSYFPACDVDAGFCGTCAQDSDCASTPATPHCAPGAFCVACADSSQCGSGLVCQGQRCTAVPGAQDCQGVFSCLSRCPPTDAQCASACTGAAVASAQSALPALLTCLGSVCETASPSFNLTNCYSAYQSAVQLGTSCAQPLATCQATCARSTDCSYGNLCAAGVCQPIPSNANCPQLLSCYAGCAASDPSCEGDCFGGATSAAQNASDGVLSCLQAQCADLNGGVCDSTATGFSASACAACTSAAEQPGGACAAAWLTCSPPGTGCSSDSNCPPATPYCAISGGNAQCVQCLNTSQCDGGTCLGGSCQGLPSGLSCAETFAYTVECPAGDGQCTGNAAASLAPVAQSNFQALTNCVAAACPDAGSGVCGVPSGYEGPCQQCVINSVAGGSGPCVSQWSDCTQSLCSVPSDCDPTPSTPLCAPSGACVQCLQSSDCDGGTCLLNACQALPEGQGCPEVFSGIEACATGDQACVNNWVATTAQPATRNVGDMVDCFADAGCLGADVGSCAEVGSQCPTQWAWCSGNLCHTDSDCLAGLPDGGLDGGRLPDGGVPTPHCASVSDFAVAAPSGYYTPQAGEPGQCVQCTTTSQCPAGQSCLLGSCGAFSTYGATSCAAVVNCTLECAAADTACRAACAALASSSGIDGGTPPRTVFKALQSCLTASCPPTGGGPCDLSSPAFTAEGCAACERGSVDGGMCAPQWGACSTP